MATITVSAAVYASKNRGRDVTDTRQEIVNTGNSEINVISETFPPDPDHGKKKHFTITLSVNNGPLQYMGAEEGTTLVLPPQ